MNQSDKLHALQRCAGLQSVGPQHETELKRETELTREMVRLHGVTEALLIGVGNIESRLAPILRPGADEQSATPEESVTTEIGKKIREATNRVELALRLISNINGRLEI